MLSIEMLAAGHGDALWIEYGNSLAPRVVAIDGGPQEDDSPLLARMRQRTAGGARLRIELLVVSHVDADHIDGVLAALKSLPSGVTFGDIWFNGSEHLGPGDLLGPGTGELLSEELRRKGLPWNEAFGSSAATDHASSANNAVVVHPDVDLPSVDVAGLQVTLLSPTPAKLTKLRKVWRSVVQRAGVAKDTMGDLPIDEQETPTESAYDLLGRTDMWPPDICTLADIPPTLDKAEANGSSIGMLAEYQEGGKTCRFLLTADCHSPVLEDSLDRLLAARGIERLPLDAFKLPHHGSRHNLTNRLLDKVRCRRYLISTNGERSGHPDHEALARVIVRGGPDAALLFNYESAFNQGWKNPPPGTPSYSTEYGNGVLRVQLL